MKRNLVLVLGIFFLTVLMAGIVIGIMSSPRITAAEKPQAEKMDREMVLKMYKDLWVPSTPIELILHSPIKI